jgi:protein-tyrosine phosphatase
VDKDHRAKWDFSQISEYIFLGADMCCGGDHYDFLTEEMGIVADVAIVEEELEPPSKNLQAFLWLPVKDHAAPSRMQFNTGVRFIESAVKNLQKVFVHCRLGHGRGPTLVAAYLISTGMGLEEAVENIKAARPEVHLSKVQKEALKKYAS